MKKGLFLSFTFIVAVTVVVAATISVMQQFTTVNSNTGTPVQLTNAPIMATAVTLIGTKAPQTTNTTTVWVSYGQSANGAQAVPVAPGSVVNLVLDPGRAFFVLSNIWMDVSTANDGVTVLFDQVK